MNVFFETAKGKPDYDVVESNLSFFRHAFKKALGILYLSGMSFSYGCFLCDFVIGISVMSVYCLTSLQATNHLRTT